MTAAGPHDLIFTLEFRDLQVTLGIYDKGIEHPADEVNQSKDRDRLIERRKPEEPLILLTVFVAQGHNPVHVISIVHNITREVFDIHANIWSFFHL